ncbi:hypothetical protein QCE64_33715 [Caballeronia sp. LZ043]|nr:hypothetical protein [Caballeronia sp. LZ043]
MAQRVSASGGWICSLFGSWKTARRNVADPKRLFWTPQSGNLVKANKAYWPITWWRLTPSGSGRQALYTAAGHVTHGKANSDKTLFVYDEPRGWMPAVFANGEVHVFHTLETFHRFAARHRRTVKPLLLPSTKPLADQVIDRRLAVSGAIPNCMVFRGGTDLGHGVFSVVDSAWNTVVTKSYYYRKDDCYRKLDLKESSHEDGPIASSDLALYGHIGYEFEHEPYLLHLVFSKREGLLPSIMNDQGMLDGMRTVAGASNTSASPLLLELARRFGSEGTYTYAGQLPGKDGSLYHDLLGEPSELKMFLAGKYWPFEWKNASEGVVHVSFSDGSPYDVRLCLNDRNWTPEWGGRPTPPWLTECLKIMMSQGRMGVRLVGEAEKQWARRPLMDAPEVLRIVSVCLSRLEKENRAGGSDESWISVMILSTQLLAFFGREVKTGLTNLEFSPQVLVQLSRILAGEDVTERIDTAAMDDAADPTNSVTALEEIDGELNDIEAQQGNLSKSITTTKDVLKKAIHILTGKPSQIFSDVSFGDKLILASEVLWDYLLKSNDQTHNLIWAKNYLSWLTKTHKELETKKNALEDRRKQLGSEDDYKRTWQAYRAGLERGKSLEKKYSFPIDWESQRDDVNQRTLWAQYSGALAEVALRSQSRKPRGENNESADAEADSASYFLWKRYSEISRFQQLIGAVGQKIKDKKIRPKGRYTDITDCVQFASDIIYEEDSNEIEFCHTDLALLAVLIYTISTTSKSLDNIREQDHEGLRTAFLEQSQMLHPYAVLPSKPQPYVSLAEVKPSSLMGSGNERYENYKKQFDSYREAGLSYDAGVLVRSGLENVQLRYENMYDIQTIVNLDIDWVGAKSRAHFIKLRDNSCLFYFISKSVTTEGLPERWSTTIEKSVTEWKTGMEWLPAMPMSANDVRDYGEALKAMQSYLGEALSNLTAYGKEQSVYFGEVKYKVDDKAESGGPEYQFTTTQEKIRVPEGTVLGTELVPYLLRETERDLDVMTDLLYTSMLELSQTDKWIGFFVLFYSEVRKASLDKSYRVDPFAILVDVTSLLLTVIPSARATAKIVKGIRPMSMWTLGIRTGLHGRQLINHVAAQIPKKAMLKVGREVVSMLYELFFPFSVPFNPLTLNFRGLISKNRLLIMPRSPFEIFSDIHLVKGFLENAILPAKIAALGKAPAKPKGRVQRVGPDIYRSEITVTVNENPYAIYYIKVKEDYYEIEWDPNFFQASLSNHSAPFAPWLRRRFADWVETTSPRGGGGSVSPMWAGPGVDRTSDQAKSRVQELRRAKSDALTLLRSARNVATSDASDIQVKVQKVFQMFWQDAGEAAIHSFASNVANIIGYLAQVSVSNDVAYLNNQEGAWLSAMPGSAFDLAQTRDVAASINGNDVDADHNQQAGAITGPGFVSENRITEPTRFIARSEIIPMAIRDDNFDVSAYQYDVTAYLVRANELCRNVIREGFVATTSNRRSLRKWDALLASEPLRLATLSDADRQLFIDQLSQTYGIFLFEGQPRSARPSAAFVEAGSRGWNATGDEVGVDISSLLRTDRTLSPGESATAARAADPDLFCYLVIVLSDIKADPARFADFTTRFSQAGVNDPLLWKWFQ